MELTPVQIRVLGCLIEKQRTTPETYPLTVNALRAACNQSTNRDPVVAYDEPAVREAASALSRRRLVRLASGQGSRATKYRHVANEALGLASEELAVLSVLMLRGPQTPGELKSRADRLHAFSVLEEVHATLARLIQRELVARIGRRPGQKEERYAQLLGGQGEGEADPLAEVAAASGAGGQGSGAGATAEAPGHPPATAPGDASPGGDHGPPLDHDPDGSLEERIVQLEAEVRQLRETLEALRRDLGDLDAGQAAPHP